jgi:hypothetical protein
MGDGGGVQENGPDAWPFHNVIQSPLRLRAAAMRRMVKRWVTKLVTQTVMQLVTLTRESRNRRQD